MAGFSCLNVQSKSDSSVAMLLQNDKREDVICHSERVCERRISGNLERKTTFVVVLFAKAKTG